MTESREQALRDTLAEALSEVEAAEHALDGLLRELRVAPRAEKVTVTTVVEAAFARLRRARTRLAKLHELVASSGG